MKAIVTVIGIDRVGIIAKVCSTLAAHKVNILDISQTILQEYFTMLMLVDVSDSDISFSELSKILKELGDEMGLSIRIQLKDIFDSMHRI